ncbi:MAG: hypothetical protein ACPLZF_07570 [Nitrososphaeria archaeon]
MVVVLVWIVVFAVCFLTKEQPFLDYDITAPAYMSFEQLTVGGLIAAIVAVVFFAFIAITIKVMLE